MTRMIFLLLTGLLLWTAPAWATDYWIATSGNNSNACSSVDSVEADPPTDPGVYKLTIASASACLSAGDRIIVKAGTYSSSGMEWTNPIAGVGDTNYTVLMADPSGARPVINYNGAGAQRGIYCTNG